MDGYDRLLQKIFKKKNNNNKLKLLPESVQKRKGKGKTRKFSLWD